MDNQKLSQELLIIIFIMLIIVGFGIVHIIIVIHLQVVYVIYASMQPLYPPMTLNPSIKTARPLTPMEQFADKLEVRYAAALCAFEK